MAKDTEKLIRQLSLISFLMAERRPVSALEIKQDVEGYSEMNDDAFARRFYADRAELEALGIDLKVEKPPEGYFEAELYTLPPENFYLPPIKFSDGELGALQTSLSLLDGRFAYAEPLRLALQQLSWGRPSPLGSARPAPGRRGRHRLGRRPRALPAAGEGRDRDLAPQDDRVRLLLDRARRAPRKRKVDPYHLLYQGGQFYLVGLLARARRHPRVPAHRGSARRCPTRPRPSTTSPRPRTSTRGPTPSRADWQLGEPAGDGTGVDLGADRVARRARLRPPRLLRGGDAERQAVARRRARASPGPGAVFTTEYAQPRQLIAWVLGLGEHARLLDPQELVDEAAERIDTILERHADPEPDFLAEPVAKHDVTHGVDPAENGYSTVEPQRARRDADPARALRAPDRAGRHPDPGRPRGPQAERQPRCASGSR